MKISERRALRRAERAHGMTRETRDRTNALVGTLNLPTGIVGSAMTSSTPRDIDVRLILPDGRDA